MVHCDNLFQVKDVMRNNLGKIADRGDKLEDIEGRAGEEAGLGCGHIKDNHWSGDLVKAWPWGWGGGGYHRAGEGAYHGAGEEEVITGLGRRHWVPCVAAYHQWSKQRGCVVDVYVCGYVHMCLYVCCVRVYMYACVCLYVCDCLVCVVYVCTLYMYVYICIHVHMCVCLVQKWYLYLVRSFCNHSNPQTQRN